MLRWLRSRGRRPAHKGAWDASIDIGRADGLAAVRRLVREVPGAGWVSVEAHAGAATSVRLFAPGTSVALTGDDWAELRQRVEAAVRAGLEEAERGGWAVAEAAPSGFAEAAPRSPFEALEQLAALAALGRRTPPGDVPLPAPSPPVPAQPLAALEIPPEDKEDVQRLATLLGLVLPADPTPAAAASVQRFGSYAAVLAAPEAELRAVPGLGTHCIAAIKLVHAAAIRLSRGGLVARPLLADKQLLLDYLAAALARERVEQFRILFLDKDGMLAADEVQARGTVNHTPVYPREVVSRALALNASATILVHNHPSGDPSPSREDLEMTLMVREAAAVMKIGLRDHLIVGNGRWLSFHEEGLLR